jgi:hypothetical protein
MPVAFLIVVAVMCLAPQAIAQQHDALAERKIANLSKRLETANNERDRAALAADVRSELKAFVEHSLHESDAAQTIEQRLGHVLRTQHPDQEESDSPKARVVNLKYGRSVVLTYSVVRPPHFDLPTLTAFTEVGGDFRQVATTGDDLEGYTMFTHALPSPSKDVMWLLVGGKAFTFNGSRYRFRVYTFDGDRFETMWSPDDVYDATIHLSADGFSLTHTPRRQEPPVTERYRITLNGLTQVR